MMNKKTLIFGTLVLLLVVAGALLLTDGGPGDDRAPEAAGPLAAAETLQPDTRTDPGEPGDSAAPADSPATDATGSAGVVTAPAAERPAPEPPRSSSAVADADGRADTGGDADRAEPVAASGQEVSTDEILRATSARYEGVRSLKAEFRQELVNPLLGTRTRSAGTLYQRQPDRFLMRFSEPEGDVIVSDGRAFWLYFPSVDEKQVIRSSRGSGGLDLRSQFIGDPVQRFEATYHGRETVGARPAHVLTLVPRERLGYQSLKVWVDARDHLVRRFELTEGNGNVRRFELSDLEINPTLSDALFEFTPPPGAHVVDRG